jgi:hypothetical protein
VGEGEPVMIRGVLQWLNSIRLADFHHIATLSAHVDTQSVTLEQLVQTVHAHYRYCVNAQR